MSISTTSGLRSPREPHRLPSVAGVPDDLDPVVAVEDRLERLGEEAVVVGYEHTNVSHGFPAPHRPEEMCLVRLDL